MTFRTVRRPDDRVVILEHIESGDRCTSSISRRSHIFELCKDGDEVTYTVLGYARNTLDAQSQLSASEEQNKSR